MKAKVGLGLLVVALVGGAALAWAAFQRQKPAPGLTLAGTVEARDVEVGSLIGGRVRTVHVEEGAVVAAGQPLVTFEGDFVDIQVREQDARVAEAEAGLARVVAGPRTEETARARAEAHEMERERGRLAALMAEGIVARQQYDQAATRATTAQELLRQLERGSRPEDLSAARAVVAREQGRRDYLLRQRVETVVTAPVAGIVQTLDLRPGDLVPAGRAVAALLEPSQLWVRVYVPEPELGRIRVGQGARAFVDTFPDRPFPGRVVEVRSRAEYTPRNVQTLSQRNEQVFGVKVQMEPAPELRPGMAALVRLDD